eukprot:424828_1
MEITQKKSTKLHIQENTSVNTNNENTQPGQNYCNWLQLSRQKLKERDDKLLEIKITKIELIVNEQFQHKYVDNDTIFLVTQDVIDNALNKLYNLIDNWKGLSVARITNSFKKYTDYFKAAKGSYDQRKKQIFGRIFWLPIFKNIQKCTDHKSVNSDNVLFNIISALFRGTIKYVNTKFVRLINAGTVMCSVEMQKYLYSLHDSLQIEKWIQQYNNSKQKAAIIMNKIQSELINLTNNNGKTIRAQRKDDSKTLLSNRRTGHMVNYYLNNHGISYRCSNARYSPMSSNVLQQINLLPIFKNTI